MSMQLNITKRASFSMPLNRLRKMINCKQRAAAANSDSQFQFHLFFFHLIVNDHIATYFAFCLVLSFLIIHATFHGATANTRSEYTARD